MDHHLETNRAPERSAGPLIRVIGLAALEFQKTQLDAAQRFAIDFGLVIEDRSANTLVLRGADAGPPLLTIRRGESARFVGSTFRASDADDVGLLAAAWEVPVQDSPNGPWVATTDPGGLPVRVLYCREALPVLPAAPPQLLNMVAEPQRVNDPVRPELRPAPVRRLSHVALQTPHFRASVDWYMENLGLIVSDYQYLPSLPDEHGPCVAYLRCDMGSMPTHHHTIKLTLGPQAFGHAGFAVTDLDTMAMGGRYLAEQGHTHGWGVGRHVVGSELFNYWLDADGVVFQHHTDGDVLDASAAATWSPLTAQRDASWGPAPSSDFAATGVSTGSIRQSVGGLLDRSNEITPRYLREIARLARSAN